MQLRLPPRAVKYLRPTTGPRAVPRLHEWIVLELTFGRRLSQYAPQLLCLEPLSSVPPPLVFSDRLTGRNGEVFHDKRQGAHRAHTKSLRNRKPQEELESEYNVWASDYDADLRVLGFSGPRAGAETLANYMTDREAKILDAGAGTGMVGKELARLGFKHITALDLSPGMLMEAEKNQSMRS